MAGIDDILKQLPIDDIATRLGVDKKTARAAVVEGGQTILTGLKKETESPEGTAALSKALTQHVGQKNVSSTADIDEADGRGILGHVFGGQQDEVAARLGSSSKSAGGVDFGQLLPMLAPIIMNFIANKKDDDEKSGSDGGLDLGDLLGGVLGGGSAKGGGLDLGAIGGMLGGIFGKK